MQTSEIEQLLAAALPECEIAVEGGEGKYLVSATGNAVSYTHLTLPTICSV